MGTNYSLSSCHWEDDPDPSNIVQNCINVFVQLLRIGVSDEEIHASSNTYIVALGCQMKIGPKSSQMIQQRLLLLLAGIAT